MAKKKLKEKYNYFTSFDDTVYDGLLLNAEYFDMIKDPIKRTYIIDYTYEFGESFVIEQVLNGAEVEKEHTTNFEIALQIAVDHLIESIYYYIELAKMENKLKLMENISLEEGIKFNKYFDPMIGTPGEFYKSPKKVFEYSENIASTLKDIKGMWVLEEIEKYIKILREYDECLIAIEQDSKTKDWYLTITLDPSSSKHILRVNEGPTSLPFELLFYFVQGFLLYPSDYFNGE